MSNIEPGRRELLGALLEGPARTSVEERRAAFDNAGLSGAAAVLVDKVARHADRVTDDDIASAEAGGLTEDRIYELVVCAATGQATRQYECALAALKAVAPKG